MKYGVGEWGEIKDADVRLDKAPSVKLAEMMWGDEADKMISRCQTWGEMRPV